MPSASASSSMVSASAFVTCADAVLVAEQVHHLRIEDLVGDALRLARISRPYLA